LPGIVFVQETSPVFSTPLLVGSASPEKNENSSELSSQNKDTYRLERKGICPQRQVLQVVATAVSSFKSLLFPTETELAVSGLEFKTEFSASDDSFVIGQKSELLLKPNHPNYRSGLSVDERRIAVRSLCNLRQETATGTVAMGTNKHTPVHRSLLDSRGFSPSPMPLYGSP